MLTKDIRKLAEAGTEVAVIPRAVIEQHSGIRAHGALRARIIKVYDKPKQGVNMRYRDEKVIARVVVTDDSRSSGVTAGTEYQVSARRIIGTWAEREQTLAADRERQEQHRVKLEQDVIANQLRSDSLNERQRKAGLLVKRHLSAEPEVYIEFYVNGQTGALAARQNIESAPLIERLLSALED